MKFGVGDDVTVPEAKEQALPLRVLVVTDLVPRAPYNAGANAPEGAIRVDAESFDDLFKKIRPRISVDVPSVLADGRAARVDLSPTSLRSFRPDGLCEEVPLLRSLLDGRMVLERLRDGGVSPEQAQQELQRLWQGSPFVREVFGLLPLKSGDGPKPATAPAPAAEEAPSNVDALLDMVDLSGSGSSSPAPARPEPEVRTSAAEAMPSKFSALIASVVAAARTGSGGIRPNEAVNRIDKAISIQVSAILQHPEVRRLEEAWRGVRFLVDRAKNGAAIKIDVISARPDEAAEALVRGVRENPTGEPPVSFAVVDLAVDNTALGLARLETLATAAETFVVPVIVNGSAKLLGLDSLVGLERIDHKMALFEAPHQAPWRAVAYKPELRWASVALNAVIARGPYDKTTSRVREAAIKEMPDDESSYVWTAPAFAVASVALASFRETGWPCRVLGARSGGMVENLPVRQMHTGGDEDGETGIAIPTEVYITTDSQRELAKMGILALASAPNSDAAVVLNAPTAYVQPPKKTYDSATTEPEHRPERASLVDQLFVSRLVQCLRVICAKIPATTAPVDAKSAVEKGLWELFVDSKPASVEISVKGQKGDEGTFVSVTVRPRRFLGVQLDELSLDMPLG